MAFLDTRRGLLDGVVFSGGEPTLQHALLEAMQSVRNLGFRIGLHTAGIAAEQFASLLPLVDWMGFDVKAPFSTYSRVTGVERSGDVALASLRMLLASSIAYEVRTTLHPALLSMSDMCLLRDELLSLGVGHYAVQHFRSTGVSTDRLASIEERQLQLPVDFGEHFQSFQIR
jgi:pyruvate formate lyase activating enzyme